MSIEGKLTHMLDGTTQGRRISFVVPRLPSARFDCVPQVSLGILTIATIVKRLGLAYEFLTQRANVGPPQPSDETAILCYSANIGTFQDIETHLAAISRSDNVPFVVVGGALATSLPMEWLRCRAVDVVFTGEADISFAALLKRVPLENIPGVAYFKKGSDVLRSARMPKEEEIVYPDYGILQENFPTETSIQVQIGRGCNYECGICSNRLGHVRTNIEEFERSIYQVIDGGHRKITFVDNNFFATPFHQVLEIVARHRSVIEWSCSIKSDYDMCVEHLPAMIDAGCVQLSIDVQHVAGSIHERNRLFGLKYAKRGVDYYVELVRFVRKHGIEPTVCFHLGLRGETTETIQAAQKFFEVTGVGAYDLRPFVYPGSEHFELAFEKGKQLGIVDTRFEYQALVSRYLNNGDILDEDVAAMVDVFNLSAVGTDTLIDRIAYLKGLAT